MRRRLAVGMLLAWSAAACGALLGIEQLPLLDEPDGAAFEAGDAGDGAAACSPDPRLGCQQCPHAFCDDFDLDAGEAGVGTRWISPATLLGGPVIQERDGSVVRAHQVAENVSPPFGFEAFVSSTDRSSLVFLANQVARAEAGTSFAGVRYRFQTRVQTLQVAKNGARITDAGGAIFAGIGPTDVSRAVALFLNDEGLGVVLGANLYNVDDVDGSVYNVTPLTGFGDLFLIDIYVTTRERALAENLVKCQTVTSPTVVAVRVNSYVHACYAPIDALANLEWTRAPIILLGSSTFGKGTIGLVHDNVEVDFLE